MTAVNMNYATNADLGFNNVATTAVFWCYQNAFNSSRVVNMKMYTITRWSP